MADEPRWSPTVSLSGCGLDERLAPTRTTDLYTYRFPIRPRVQGMLEITVHGHSADTPLVSGGDRVVWLTGNTSAPAHVGPTRDGYRWSVACSDEVDEGDRIEADPAKDVYSPGEQVTLTTPGALEADGFWHCFSHWEVEPDVTQEPDGTVLWLTMDDDVTATAWYDTMEPGLDCEGGGD